MSLQLNKKSNINIGQHVWKKRMSSSILMYTYHRPNYAQVFCQECDKVKDVTCHLCSECL